MRTQTKKNLRNLNGGVRGLGRSSRNNPSSTKKKSGSRFTLPTLPRIPKFNFGRTKKIENQHLINPSHNESTVQPSKGIIKRIINKGRSLTKKLSKKLSKKIYKLVDGELYMLLNDYNNKKIVKNKLKFLDNPDNGVTNRNKICSLMIEHILKRKLGKSWLKKKISIKTSEILESEFKLFNSRAKNNVLETYFITDFIKNFNDELKKTLSSFEIKFTDCKIKKGNNNMFEFSNKNQQLCVVTVNTISQDYKKLENILKKISIYIYKQLNPSMNKKRVKFNNKITVKEISSLNASRSPNASNAPSPQTSTSSPKALSSPKAPSSLNAPSSPKAPSSPISTSSSVIPTSTTSSPNASSSPNSITNSLESNTRSGSYRSALNSNKLSSLPNSSSSDNDSFSNELGNNSSSSNDLTIPQHSSSSKNSNKGLNTFIKNLEQTRQQAAENVRKLKKIKTEENIKSIIRKVLASTNTVKSAYYDNDLSDDATSKLIKHGFTVRQLNPPSFVAFKQPSYDKYEISYIPDKKSKNISSSNNIEKFIQKTINNLEKQKQIETGKKIKSIMTTVFASSDQSAKFESISNDEKKILKKHGFIVDEIPYVHYDLGAHRYKVSFTGKKN